MRTCSTCGRPVEGNACPSCGEPPAGEAGDALLLPSGRLGALAAAGLTVLLFAGIWGLFTWLAPEPAPAAIATAAPAPPSPSPTPSPTPPPTPASAPVVATEESTPSVDWDAVARLVAPAATRVQSDRCGTPGQVGTGVLVAADRLLTASHLVVGASSITVRQDTEVRRGRLVAVDSTADIALVALAAPLAGPPLSVVPALVDADDDVGVVTREGADGAASVRTGSVRALDLRVETRRGELGDVLTLRQPTDGLLAGAPVVTSDGELVGMTLVDHVSRTQADTTYVLSGQAVADRVATWAGARARAVRSCPAPTPTPTPVAPSTATPSPTPAPPPSPTPDPFVVTDEASWIAVLESYRLADNDQATMVARVDDINRRLALPRQGIRTQRLRSDAWPSLEPGLWVLYLGEWSTRGDAADACTAVQAVSPGCYPAPLQR